MRAVRVHHRTSARPVRRHLQSTPLPLEVVLHGAGGRVGHVDGPQRRAGPGDRADVDEARRVEEVNRQVGAVHRAEHLLARIPQAALAPDVLLGAAGGARRLQKQIAPDEEQHFPTARCALNRVGDPLDRLEHAEAAQASAVVKRCSSCGRSTRRGSRPRFPSPSRRCPC